MKAYTDLEQSRKLAEILPAESAEMNYSTWTILDGEFIVSPNQGSTIESLQEDYGNQIIPCWSLAALRSFLPCEINIDNTLHVFESHKTFDNDWVYVYKFENSEPLYIKALNEIDACFEMINKLNELNLL